MTQESETTAISVEARLTFEGEELLGDPSVQVLAGLALAAYVVGRFVIGHRDPSKPRNWRDWRRIG